MRNLLDKSSIAQSLDGTRLMGSSAFPRKRKLVRKGPACKVFAGGQMVGTARSAPLPALRA